MTRLTRIPFVAALLASIWLALTGLTAQAAALEKPEVSIAVGGKAGFYYLPLTVAERLGYFKDEGLKVEISDFPGGSKALQAVIGGSADVVSGDYSHIIDLLPKGQVMKAFVLQGRAPVLALGVSTKTMAGYKSPADLKGKTIGVSAPGSGTHIALNQFLTKHGLKGTDVSVVGVGVAAGAVAAMRAGKIDALVNIDPTMTLLESSNDIKVIADARTPAGATEWFGGAYPAACLYAPAEFVDKNPNTAQALANAIVRALKWLQSATPEQVAAIVPPEYLAGDKNLFLTTFQKVKDTYSVDGMIAADATKIAVKLAASFNPAVDPAKIKLEQTYDNRFAVAAQKRVN